MEWNRKSNPENQDIRALCSLRQSAYKSKCLWTNTSTRTEGRHPYNSCYLSPWYHLQVHVTDREEREHHGFHCCLTNKMLRGLWATRGSTNHWTWMNATAEGVRKKKALNPVVLHPWEGIWSYTTDCLEENFFRPLTTARAASAGGLPCSRISINNA